MDMDDMMNASFDDLRREIAPAAQSAFGPGAAATMAMAGGMRSIMGGASAVPMLMGGGNRGPRALVIPEHRQELQVFLCGKGAKPAAGVEVLDSQTALAACSGKNDFILFEPLDEAMRRGQAVVLVLPMGASRKELNQAQAYLAQSLARWLSEEKTDGAGRPYGEVKDEDPTLRKHFTRAQINAIRSFGGGNEGK